jgi:predicted nucleic acid-binding protein
MQKYQLVAIDTNILLGLGEKDEDTEDALRLILKRAAPVQIILCPTVLQETSFLSVNAGDPAKRTAAVRSIGEIPRWNLYPNTLNAVQRAIADQAAARLLQRGLVPAKERNDARILAEAAVLGCVLLVSKDSHLIGIDAFALSMLFHELDLIVPVVTTPRDLLRKFYR